MTRNKQQARERKTRNFKKASAAEWLQTTHHHHNGAVLFFVSKLTALHERNKGEMHPISEWFGTNENNFLSFPSWMWILQQQSAIISLLR